MDRSNNVWIGDYGNNRILVFFIPLVTDTVADVVFGQNGSFTSNTCNLGGVSGNPTAKSLCNPDIMAFDGAGDLFATDESNCRVIKYNNPLGTTPPNTTANQVFGQGGSFISRGCNASGVTATSLNLPDGIDFDGSGNFFIADRQNNRVLEFKPPFAASPIPAVVFGQKGSFTSNSCNFGSSPSIAAANSLCVPDGIAADTNGNLWINDQSNNRVLRFTPPFPASSPGPSANLVMGQLNFADNAPNSVDSTSYDFPSGVAIDRSAPTNRLYVADTRNNRVLGYINAVTFFNGGPASLVIGQVDFGGAAANQGVSPGANTLNGPTGVAVNAATGDLFVADTGNSRVLRFAAPFSSGKVANQSANAVFGQGGNFTAISCLTPTATSMCNPAGVALDSVGNLYVAD
ncbi:MAG TPA: NHL repeat-containing protein, partial [Candidatus Binataceae bacterium]